MLLLPDFLLVQKIKLDSHNIRMLLFVGILASIIASFLVGLRPYVPVANIAVIFINLIPVLSVIIAVLMLHKQLHTYHLLDGDITLLDMILSHAYPLRGSARKI